MLSPTRRIDEAILPGAIVGVFGSGQLGRMLAISARSMGYKIHTFSPEKNSPTGQVADLEICADYDDLSAVRSFVQAVDVVTFEFENVASHVARIAGEAGKPVRPAGHVLHTAQQRQREKSFLAAAGLPVTPFAPVVESGDLERALEKVGCPAVLKTAAFGYDGKGQVLIESPGDAAKAWDRLERRPAILEAFITYDKEISVVAARGVDAAFAHYGAIENIHHRHILDISIAPARIDQSIATAAVELAHRVMEALEVVGVLCVEFFVLESGALLINEIAPRPHNSGHLTIDAAVTSQFEQQLRAVCGLPLGRTDLLQAAVMVNLLGDLWQAATPNWEAALKFDRVKLHLYGKADARAGRKMGHLTALAENNEVALEQALAARDALTG